MMGTYSINNPDELYHHGVKGMRWGIRRYQSYDSKPRKSGKRGAFLKSQPSPSKVSSINERLYNISDFDPIRLIDYEYEMIMNNCIDELMDDNIYSFLFEGNDYFYTVAKPPYSDYTEFVVIDKEKIPDTDTGLYERNKYVP